MPRHPLQKIVIAILALGIGFAGGWAWVQQKQAADTAFREKRLTLLQEENDRLHALVAGYERAKSQAAQAGRRAGIEKTTSRIRGLPFKRPVTYDILTRAGIQKVLQQKFAEQYSDAEFEKTRLGYAALGLIPPDYPLKQRYLELLGEQVAAFYDQRVHRLFMFEDASLDSPQNRVILSHELTHALQDQHFVLSKLPLDLHNNDDRAGAASALVEGDATLVMNEFMAGDLSLDALRENVGGLFTKSLDQLQTVPRMLRDSLVFPYIAGLKFCQTLYQQDGEAGINAAFARLPASTSQIIHPEKYLANEQPITVSWPDTTALGESPLSDNVLGELGVRILLSDWTDEPTAQTVAPGWRGDRYLVFDHGKALVWRTVWDSPGSAGQFVTAAKRMHENRVKSNGTPGTLAKTLNATGNRIFEVKIIRDNEVLLIEAADARWAEALREKFSR